MKTVRPIHLIALGDTFGKLVFRTKDNVLFFYQHYGAMPGMGDERHHLHFLSKEPVQNGDWYYDEHNNILMLANENSDHNVYLCPKVVATSDDKLHKEYGIPMISDQNIFEYSHKNGKIESLELVTEEKYIEPHESIHSNRGRFIDVLKLNEEGEVIIYVEPPVMVDWNQFPISNLIEHLEDKFKFDSSGTAKAVYELISKHNQMKEGLEWIKKEYIRNVNDSDEILDKIDELLNDQQIKQ
ncbi:MAG: hypothetical protein AABY15_02620 [Nanoarchaeota archaeon]